jgi:3-oxoacyl-[acyl-carrier protein] reductase
MSASNRVNQIAGHLNYPKGMLAGQVAIITGSGQGIGAEAARLFANEGAKVVVADVDASKSISCSIYSFICATNTSNAAQRKRSP